MSRKAYPTDVSDEKWEFVAPYLTLIREDAAQRPYRLRAWFDAVRWMVKAARRSWFFVIICVGALGSGADHICRNGGASEPHHGRCGCKWGRRANTKGMITTAVDAAARTPMVWLEWSATAP